jgi:hypothetical protein
MGGPIAAGVVLAYCILKEVFKARRNDRHAKQEKYYSPGQIATASQILKNILGPRGEALAVVDSLTSEQKNTPYNNDLSYHDDFGASPIRRLPLNFMNTQYKQKSQKVYPPPGKTNPLWAQQLAGILLDITGGNLNKINQFRLPPPEYIQLQQNIANGEVDSILQELTGKSIPWTHTGNKTIYIEPSTGSITGTLLFTVDPHDRDEADIPSIESNLITLTELKKYIEDVKSNIIYALQNEFKYIYNTKTGTLDTDIENHGELTNEEKMIIINADNLNFEIDYDLDVKHPPKDPNTALILVGTRGLGDKSLPPEALDPAYESLRILRSHVNDDLKTGYFYYKKKPSGNSHGVDGGKFNGDETWHELLHLLGLEDRYFAVIYEDQSNPESIDPVSLSKPNAAAGDNNLTKEGSDYNYLNNTMSNGGEELTQRQLKIILDKRLIENKFPPISIIHYVSLPKRINNEGKKVIDEIELKKETNKYDGIYFKGDPHEVKLVKLVNGVIEEYKSNVNYWYVGPKFTPISEDAKRLLYYDKTIVTQFNLTLGEFLRLFISINHLF